MEDNIKIIRVRTLPNGLSAVEINSSDRGRVFKILEIVLGSGSHKKIMKYEKNFLAPGGEHNAEIIANERIRII